MRNLAAAVEAIDPLVVTGKVAGVSGLLIESKGGLSRLAVGARAEIERGRGLSALPAEVVGFRDAKALLMPFGPVEGVAPGADIRIIDTAASVRPTTAWLGRIIDAFGNPIDGKGPLPQGPASYPLRAPPPPAHSRGRVGERLDLGCGHRTSSPPPAGPAPRHLRRLRRPASRCCCPCWPSRPPAMSSSSA